MLLLVFSLVLSLSAGYLLVDRLTPPTADSAVDRWIRLSLGAGAGLGLSACIFFLGLLMHTPSGIGLREVDTGIHMGLILGLLAVRKYRPKGRSDGFPKVSFRGGSILHYLFWGGVIISLISFVAMALQLPYGGQDAQGIWNIKARILLKATDHWRQDLWTIGYHGDYPLLLPALVARCWAYYGDTVWWAPVLVQGIFTYGAIFCLTSMVTALRGKRMGLIAGWVLLGTPFFLREGAAAQQADVATAYFILGAMALACLKICRFDDERRLDIAAGLMAGLAAWTKNEGILFALVLVGILTLGRLIRNGKKEGVQTLAALSVGILPVFILLIYFKLRIAPANDLVSGQGLQATLGRLSDVSRYIRILTAFIKGMLAFDRWQLYPLLLAVYVAMAGLTRRKENRSAAATTVGVILMMLCGYFCVYLTSPHDLEWHLGTALHRILLHMWPSALLMVFMVVRRVEIGKPGVGSPDRYGSIV